VKDDAERHAAAVSDGADAMTHRDPIVAARPRDRTLAGGENDAGALFDPESVTA